MQADDRDTGRGCETAERVGVELRPPRPPQLVDDDEAARPMVGVRPCRETFLGLPLAERTKGRYEPLVERQDADAPGAFWHVRDHDPTVDGRPGLPDSH